MVWKTSWERVGAMSAMVITFLFQNESNGVKQGILFRNVSFYSGQGNHLSKTIWHICLARGLEFVHYIQTEMNAVDMMYNTSIFLGNVAKFPERKLGLVFFITIELVDFSKSIVFYL